METDLDFSKSQIKFHIIENDKNKRKINILEEKVQSLETDLASEKIKLQTANMQIKKDEIDIDSKETIIKGMKYEKGRLEEALRDFKSENAKVVNRYEEVQKMHEVGFQIL